MRDYETIFILDPKLEESEVQGEIDKVQSAISGINGEVVGVEPAGKRRLAYEIDGNREGYYTLITFKAEPSSLTELERAYKLNERVLRHIIINLSNRKAGVDAPEAAAE
jgi:small subunit ribosomal protein S6